MVRKLWFRASKMSFLIMRVQESAHVRGFLGVVFSTFGFSLRLSEFEGSCRVRNVT